MTENFLLWGAFAAGGTLEGAVEKQPLNIAAIVMFLLFVGATLGITYWAAQRTKTAFEAKVFASKGFLYCGR